MNKGKLGKNCDLWLREPLDELWIGSTARVFNGQARGKNYAVKILRPETSSFDLPQFQTEVKILEKLNNQPWITKLHGMGFLRLSQQFSIPPDPDYVEESFQRFGPLYSAEKLSGDIISYTVSELERWLKAAPKKVGDCWLPYLVFRRRDCLPTPSRPDPKEYYLFQLLPQNSEWSMDQFRLLMQVLLSTCKIYSEIHKLNIQYNDPKLAHYGWSSIDNGTFIIDWNFSKIIDSNSTGTLIKIDLQKFGKHVISPILQGIEHAVVSDHPVLEEFKEICINVMCGIYANADELHREIEKLLDHLSSENEFLLKGSESL